MSTASVTYAFTNGTSADGTQVNTNFTDLVNFLNSSTVHSDGSVPMTGLLTLHSLDPTTANHAVRKSYADSKAQSSFPPGVIAPTLASAAPADWVLMFGQTLTNAQSTYPVLWANVDAAFKSGANLIVPDLRGRIPVGRDNMGGSAANRITAGQSGLSGTTLGAVGGDERLHAHQHTPNAVASFLINGPSSLIVLSAGDWGGGTYSPGIVTDTAVQGAGASQNVQPSIILNWILKLQ